MSCPASQRAERERRHAEHVIRRASFHEAGHAIAVLAVAAGDRSRTREVVNDVLEHGGVASP